jgi:hypothetical protein
MCLLNLVIEPVEVLRIRERFGWCIFVVRLEGSEDLLTRIPEIENEGVFLAGVGAV